MGSFANTLFTLLLGWLQGIVSAVWSAFTTEDGQSMLTWIGRHWLTIAGILCVTGLTIDLCVYLFRWKPFRVWRSFFNRGRDAGGEESYTEDSYYPESSAVRAERNAYNQPEPVPDRRELRPETPDFSKWQEEKKEEAVAVPAATERPTLVTNAGYTVPADSPYRRPVKQNAAPPEEDRSNLQEADAVPAERSKEPPISLKPSKRRRLRVNELFADPQEELIEFDAPQDIIDRKKAYHEPVYPRGWKKNEDDAP